jgi:hypothetical protein
VGFGRDFVEEFVVLEKRKKMKKKKMTWIVML